MSRFSSRFLAHIPVMLLIAGCATSLTHRLDTAVPSIPTSGHTKRYVVSTQDQRLYVLSGAKPESFVGIERGGFGNPFDVNTTSGNGLATDISTAIASALTASGAQVEVIPVAPKERELDVLGKMTSQQAKAILVTVTEWKSDTFNSSARVHYDITASIVTPDGRILTRKRIQGTEALRREVSHQLFPLVLKRKLEHLLTSPEIAAEL